jgi:hypothetical protein
MTTTISGSSGIVFPDLTTMQTGQQAVKAWVNFNGTGTVAIRAGYNVASITDNGVGDYTVNFTAAMVDSNYSTTGSSGDGGNSNATTTCIRPGTFSTSSIRISTNYSSSGTSALNDFSFNSVAIFR